MPASQEFWQCRRCGLNAHISRFVTAESRAELEVEYSKSLRQRIDDGLAAQRLLIAGRRTHTKNKSAMLLVGLGVVAAVGGLLSRFYAKH